MSDPLIFITKHTVKDGRLEDLECLNADFVEFVEANEPRILALNAYLDDTRTRLTLVQVHPVTHGLLEQIGSAGVRVTVNSNRLGGFDRLAAAAEAIAIDGAVEPAVDAAPR